MADRTLYRLLARADFQRAQEAGVFSGTAHDLRDGYIHFSTADQVRDTAAKHYAGQPQLLLLAVRESAVSQLGADVLRWEVSRGGAKFPHLYAALPMAMVHRAQELSLDATGCHIFPELDP
jgi:uncharacterized protein (DUF952 family)